jgi:seryl-tRNA synthetase
LREHPEIVSAGIAKRQTKVDLQKVADIDSEKREIQAKLDLIRSEKKKLGSKLAQLTAGAREKKMAELKKLDAEADKLDKKSGELEEELKNILVTIPNLPHESVPEGGAEDKQVIKVVGHPPKLDFKPKDHVELGKSLNLIDIDRAVKISGSRFYFLKNEAVQLEFALVNFVLTKLISKGFEPMIPPVLVKETAMFGTGHFPADKNEIYQVNPKIDDLFLVGTAEVPLIGYHANEILKEDELPKKYCGFSSCFRREAGSYGKDTRGIFRAHQFDKIEQVVICQPKDSWQMFDEIVANQEEIFGDLGIPYQVVVLAAGDMGPAAAKQIDIEAWIPSESRYREIASASNTTDYQARRQAIRYKTKDGENTLVHTLNGTACAIGRTLIAILENYQQKDGSIIIPEVLKPYMNEVHQIK